MSKSVLIVDDHPNVRTLVHHILSDSGYLAETAVDGGDALVKLGRRGFDLVISDIDMPGITGLELLDRVRTMSRRVSVVLMSAREAADGAVEAERRGADAYLAKPFRVDRIRQVVADLLN